MISTYLLCGFGGITAIAVQVAVLGAMAPTRRKDFASVVVRAFIAGKFACFMTACIAGILSLFLSRL